MSNFKKKLTDTILRVASKLGKVDEVLLGLDISSNEIRLSELKKVDGRWITNFACAHEFNETLNPKRQQDFSGLLKGLLKKHATKTRNIAVSLPMSRVQVHVVKTPLMSDLEIENAIQYDSLWDNLVRLPEDLSNYSISYQIIDRDLASNSMQILFVASLKTDIELITDICLQAGLRVVLIDCHAFAVISALQMSGWDKAEESYVLVEIGDDSNYAMTKSSTSLSFNELYVSEGDKSSLRKNYANSEALEMFFARLALQIKQSISSRSEQIRTIYVTSDFPNNDYWFSAFAKSLPNYNLILFNPLDNAPYRKKEPDQHGVFPAAAASMGMSSRSTDVFGYFNYQLEVKSLNLLPNYKKMRSDQQMALFSRMAAVVSFAACFIVVLALYVNQSIKISNLESKTAAFDEVSQRLDGLNESLSKLTGQIRETQKIITRSKTLSTNQVALAQAYGLIAKYASVGGWLHSMDYSKGVVEIVGFSKSEAAILSQVNGLSSAEIFESVQLGSVELKTFGDTNKNALEVRAYGMTIKFADENKQVSKNAQ